MDGLTNGGGAQHHFIQPEPALSLSKNSAPNMVGLAVLTVGLFFVCLALSSQYKLLYSCITLVLVTAGFVIMLVPFFSPLLRLFGLGYECEFFGYKWLGSCITLLLRTSVML